MKLSQARSLALRLTIAQNHVQLTRRANDKFVFPLAFLLAGVGVGVSSFSVKQLILSSSSKIRSV